MKSLHTAEGNANRPCSPADAQFLAALSHRGNKLGSIQASHIRVPVAWA